MLYYICSFIFSSSLFINLLNNIYNYRLNFIKKLIEMQLIGSITDWINIIILGIVLPLLFKIWEAKIEKQRNTLLKEEKRKNDKLLSVERCGKLYSKPTLSLDSSVTFYTEKKILNIIKIIESECLISDTLETDNFLSYTSLKISIPFKENSSISISQFLLNEIDIHFFDNSEIWVKSLFFNKNLDMNFKNIISNTNGSILNIYILYNKNIDISNYISNYNMRIVLKADVINPFKIQTSGTWNIILYSDFDTDFHDNSIFNFKIEKSIFQIEKITDKNIL